MPAGVPSRKLVSPGGVAIGLVVSGGLLALAFRSLALEDLRHAWDAAAPWPWVPLAALTYLAGHLVRGHRCRLLVQDHAPLTLSTASNVVVLGYASNNVLPARLGELVRAGVLAQRTGMPVLQALTITLVERLLDGLAVLALLLVAGATLGLQGWVAEMARAAGVVFGIATTVLVAAACRPSLMLLLASRLGALFGSRAADRVVGLAAGISRALEVLTRPRRLLPVLGDSLLVWCLEAGMFVLLLPALGLPLDPARGALVMSVTNLGILAPSTPGFVGTFHWFSAEALMATGVPPGVALPYALLAHLTFFVPVTCWGAATLLAYGERLGSMLATARRAREAAAPRTLEGVTIHVIAVAGPSRPGTIRRDVFLERLVEAAVSEPGVAPDPAAVQRASAFTAAQLGALSPTLRAAFWLGMAVFRAWVLLRHLDAFSRLDIGRRREALESWAFGRSRLTRQLFRPLRCFALLAYHETLALAAASPGDPRV